MLAKVKRASPAALRYDEDTKEALRRVSFC